VKIEDSKPLNIKDWSPEGRPREKFIQKGIYALTEAELIAILIGTGPIVLSIRKESVVGVYQAPWPIPR